MKYKLLEHDEDSILETVLLNRGLTLEQANEIIEPSIKEYNPFLMKNMDKGILMLEDAINNNLKIGIVPDVDLDGNTAAAILNEFITNDLNYKNVEFIMHLKYAKSHGLDDEIIEKVIDNKIELLILPDAGSTMQDFDNIIKLTKKENINVLILDHHNVEYINELNNVILINPNQKSCEYPNKNLSGCGVVYKFIQAFSEGFIDIGNKYIDLVAISLVADMMNLKDSLENRLLLNKGCLKENITSPLISEFCISKGFSGDRITIENIAFGISSNINALIRVGTNQDKEYLLKSFYSNELVKSNKRGNYGAMEIIQDEVIRRMTNTKAKQDKDVKEAVSKVKDIINRENLLKDKVLMLNVDGIIDNSINGLLANKIMNEVAHRPIFFYRPKKKNPKIVGGSMRGTKVESFKEICEKSNLFNYVSGHANANGGEIDIDKLRLLREYFNESLKDVEFDSSVEVDAVYNQTVPLDDIIEIVDFYELWCHSIKEPKFIIQNIELDTSKILKIGNATYSFKVRDMSFTKNFGSKVFIEEFAKSEMYDRKAKYPFISQRITADILVKFRKNTQGYYYLDIQDAETKLI